jgi:DDE superfamily endonuclease
VAHPAVPNDKKEKRPFDSRRLSSGDIFALTMVRPGEYRLVNDLGKHEGKIIVSYPKTPLIKNWLVKRPRFHVHFTPTYGSWLNLVERWFAALTTKQLRRGAHRSVAQLSCDSRIHRRAPRGPQAVRLDQYGR